MIRRPQMTAERITMSADEVASVLGLSLSFVYDAAARGGLPSKKLGRRRLFIRAHIERWLEEPDAPALRLQDDVESDTAIRLASSRTSSG